MSIFHFAIPTVGVILFENCSINLVPKLTVCVLFHQRVMRQWCTSIRHTRLWPGWAIPGLWQKFLPSHALLMELSKFTS